MNNDMSYQLKHKKYIIHNAGSIMFNPFDNKNQFDNKKLMIKKIENDFIVYKNIDFNNDKLNIEGLSKNEIYDVNFLLYFILPNCLPSSSGIFDIVNNIEIIQCDKSNITFEYNNCLIYVFFNDKNNISTLITLINDYIEQNLLWEYMTFRKSIYDEITENEIYKKYTYQFPEEKKIFGSIDADKITNKILDSFTETMQFFDSSTNKMQKKKIQFYDTITILFLLKNKINECKGLHNGGLVSSQQSSSEIIKQRKNVNTSTKNIFTQGGYFMLNPFRFENRFMKKKMTTYGNIMYTTNDYPTNVFNYKELNDINCLLYFILPYFLPAKNKLNVINDIEFMGAGGFGITFAHGNFLIKICKNFDNDYYGESIENEFANAFFLMNDDTPYEINKIIGYISFHEYMYKRDNNNKFTNIKGLEYRVNDNFVFYSNLFEDNQHKTNIEKNIRDSINETKKINNINKISITDTISVLFLVKASKDCSNLINDIQIKNFKPFSNINELLTVFLKNMKNALEYIHNKKNIHVDIKPQNIVISHTKTKKCFQLIDFGLLTPFQDINIGVYIRAGTPIIIDIIKGYKTHKSVIYDWFCILYSIFNFINLSLPIINDNSYSIEVINGLYALYIENAKIKGIYDNISNVLYYLLYTSYVNENACINEFIFNNEKITNNEKYLNHLYNLIDRLQVSEF